MNPDVALAVDRLGRDGTLTAEQAALFGRVARRELVSIRPELRLLLYGGVVAVMGGVGELVRQNLDRIGPVAIALGLWTAAAAALIWALRQAPPFSWGRAASTHLAFDYVLLLGVLLTGAALAYVEVKFTPLGPAWGYHLLLMSLFAAAIAVRGDSRMVASIAFTTFAAWRSVAASPLERAFWLGEAPRRRCGRTPSSPAFSSRHSGGGSSVRDGRPTSSRWRPTSGGCWSWVRSSAGSRRAGARREGSGWPFSWLERAWPRGPFDRDAFLSSAWASSAPTSA